MSACAASIARFVRARRRGFSMLEFALGMAVLALVAGAVTPVAVRYVRHEAGQKTAREMLWMLEAGRAFYVANSRWTASLGELQGAGHLPPGVLQSPFTTAYAAVTSGTQFQVSVSVPSDVAPVVVRLLPFAASSIVGGATIVSGTAAVPGTMSDSSMLLHRQGTLVGSTLLGPLEIGDQAGENPNIRSRGASATNLIEGNLGVGTSEPNPTNRRLRVVGPAARFERDDDPFVLELKRRDAPIAGNALAAIEFQGQNSNGDPHLYVAMSGHSDAVTAGAEKGSLRFYTRTGAPAPDERMRITGDGYVGIGTTAPTKPLTIQSTASGALSILNTSTGTEVASLHATGQHAGGIVLRDSAGSPKFLFQADGGIGWILGTNVGIGTTTPDSAPLAITQQGSPTPNAGGGGSLQMGVASMPVGGDRNSWLQVYNGALMLQPIGNVVGIGYPLDTYLPSHGSKLAVNGTITGTTKNFAIAHPTKAGYTLVHSVLEGPESAVYYRGEAQLQDGVVEVLLPPYFEALTRKDQRTVQLTPIGGAANLFVRGEIEHGRFVVSGRDGNRRQRFYWEVKAVRADIPPLVVEERNRRQPGGPR